MKYKELILTILRYALGIAGGYLVGKDWIAAEDVTKLTEHILDIAGIIMGAIAMGAGAAVNAKNTATVSAAKTVLEQAPAPVSKDEVAHAAAVVEAK